MISLRVVPHGSHEYWLAVDLRYQVLRLPLGLQFTAEELAAEDNQTHLIAEEEREVVGCLSLLPLDGQTMKTRQVAVAESHQRQGVGRLLVSECERLSREQGFAKISLHARDVAVPFYSALGYEIVGEPFEEVGIAHREMEKRL